MYSIFHFITRMLFRGVIFDLFYTLFQGLLRQIEVKTTKNANFHVFFAQKPQKNLED